MAVLISEDKRDLIITCGCHCNNAFRIALEDWDGVHAAYMTYVFGAHFREGWNVGRRAKKIWKILKGEDYCYSDILMTKGDWEVFKSWVNSQNFDELNESVRD